MEALPRSVDPTTDLQLITPSFDSDSKVATGTGTGTGTADSNPFGTDEVTSVWCLEEFIPEYKPIYDQKQNNGFITGSTAKEILTSSGIDIPSLRKIWDLSDIDKDGQLDFEEFIIAMFLTSRVKAGDELPATLDPEMIPLTKRN